MALVAQLILFAAFMYIWPFLLFGGLILRSTIFTRKIGGLLIAVALGGLIFTPMLYSIEYLSLANGIPNYTNMQAAYGFNAIPPIPNNQGTITPPYELNFFVQPSVKGMAEYAGCWNGDPVLNEFADVVWIQTPFGAIKYLAGLIFATLSGAASKLSSSLAPSTPYHPTYLLYSCNTDVVLKFLFLSYNVYGIDTIIGWMIPLLNLLIVLAGIRSISGMMGGDTSIAGLSKLV
jgi:hypothetical protein